MNLYIIRGLSGSGKSTLAREVKALTGADHWEADQYFVDSEGVYKFDGMKIGEAHNQCLMNFYDSLDKSRDVIVSNTFTQLKEFREYIEDALCHKYDVYVVECVNNYGSIHNVPQDVLKRMANRWQPNSALRGLVDNLSSSNAFLANNWGDVTLFNQDEFDVYLHVK